MTTPQSIRDALAASLDCSLLEVDGDGQHFQARIVSAVFEGQSRIKRHQIVYAALGDRMRAEIHALSMQSLTPEEDARLG